jgi:catechol 2,3-dioxygenase-like lactoylglutathione lyase family enzyme
MLLENTNEGGVRMKPRINVITLGVGDLERALAFYRDGLGLPTQGIVGTEFEDGAVIFFNMNEDLILALYPRSALAKDAGVTVGPPSPAEFSIGHMVKSKRDVDALMEQAERAGAKITDPARDRFWGGYSGYFQDLDGHLWEIAWNPAWEVRE